METSIRDLISPLTNAGAWVLPKTKALQGARLEAALRDFPSWSDARRIRFAGRLIVLAASRMIIQFHGLTRKADRALRGIKTLSAVAPAAEKAIASARLDVPPWSIETEVWAKRVLMMTELLEEAQGDSAEALRPLGFLVNRVALMARLIGFSMGLSRADSFLTSAVDIFVEAAEESA